MSENTGDLSSLSGEQAINRWTFDFYVFQAFDAFRNGDYTAFTHFINIIESVVVRPVDGHSDMIVKLRLMQFLSRINNGDKLDLTFEEPKTPLESALDVLESICRDMSVPQREQELIRHAIIEMLVMVCMRSSEFDKAEEMLRHFSSSSDCAGKKKLLLNLIRCRRSSHSVLQLSSYRHFKQDMLQFVEKLFKVPEPFLLQMLKRCGQPTGSTEIRTSSSSSSSSSSQDCQRTIQHSTAAKDHGVLPASAVSLFNLRQVFGLLSSQYGVSVSFSQLQQDVDTEAQQQKNRDVSEPELHLTLSDTPLERPDDNQTQQDVDTEAQQQKNRDVAEPEFHLTLSDTPLERPDDNQTQQDVDTEAQQQKSRDVAEPEFHLTLSDTPLERPDDNQTQQESHYASMTMSRLVQEDDSQLSSPDRGQRVVVLSESDDDEEVQKSTDEQQHSGTETEPQGSSAQHSTPVRHSRRSNTLANSVCEEECPSSSACLSTPARPSSPQSTRRTNTHNRRRIIDSSESEDQHLTPAAVRQQQQRNHRRVSVSCESEPDVHSTCPPAQPQRQLSPTISSSRGHKQRSKRARWQDVSGTREDWSEEDSLFGASSAPANKKYSRKMWTQQESEWLKEGVVRYGVGHWERIRSSFPFTGRTAVNLKDRWRTMVKLRLV